MNAQDIRERIERFRILVVGRANAGKTTLLKRVCNTTENPEIFDGAGKKIDADIIESSVYRGNHDIKNEVVFKSNPNFVFHDSCGFEAGGEDEFKIMKEFVSERASTFKLRERIHAIWYCIPMDEHHRAITKAEKRFFSECDTSSVPVIIVFTKFDALWDEAYAQLKESGLTRAQCKMRTPDHAKEIFAKAKTWDRLCEARYPPKDHVCLADMEKDNADCGPLLGCTTSALDEEALQMLLISTQQTNLSLCVKYAVERVLIVYIREACTSTGTSWKMSKDTCIKMQKKISAWFPHTKEWDLLLLLRRDDDDWLNRLDDLLLLLRNLRDNDDLDDLSDNLLASLQLGNLPDKKFASPTSSQLQLLCTLSQILQFGIALIIILEYSFFLLQKQKGKQKSESVFTLAATQYRTSETPAAVGEAVKEVLHQVNGHDEKLGYMVTDIILKNRISKISLAQGRK